METSNTKYTVKILQGKYGKMYTVTRLGVYYFTNSSKEKAEDIANKMNIIHEKRMANIDY